MKALTRWSIFSIAAFSVGGCSSGSVEPVSNAQIQKAYQIERSNIDRFVKSCVIKSGFEYEIEPREEVKYFSLMSVPLAEREAFAKEFGYGIHQRALLGADRQTASTGAEYQKANFACQNAAPPQTLSTLAEREVGKYEKKLDAMMKRSDWLDADERWRFCMAQSGFPKLKSSYQTVIEQQRLGDDIPPDGDARQAAILKLLRAETAIASADHECRKTTLDEVEIPLIRSIEGDLFNNNKEFGDVVRKVLSERNTDDK